VADLNMAAMVASSGATTPDAIVDALTKRFLSAPLSQKDRDVLVDFMRGKPATSEPALRELLYLVLSTPEYQLN